MVEDAGKSDLKIHNQKYILLYFAYFLLTGRRNSVNTERQSLFVCLWYCTAWQCVLNELKCNLSCLRNELQQINCLVRQKVALKAQKRQMNEFPNFSLP